MNIEDIRKLHQKKYREEAGHYLAEGEHLVLELEKAAQKNPGLLSSELYVTKEYEGWRSSLAMNVVTARQMEQISETRTPQGIVALVPMLPPKPSQVGERAIWLHEIQDPGNLGTILRSLAWFGGFRCLLSPDSVDPHNSKVIRASAGAIFHVPVEIDVELGSLSGRFARIASLDMKGDSTQSPGFHRFDCYLFGNEARGLPRQPLADMAASAFTIAGGQAIESLNLAAAVNMCLYELNRQAL
jgi:RNA methyltransferase, TrmH family